MKKNHGRAYRVLREVARRDGVTLEKVISNIEEAIEEAYTGACLRNDQKVLSEWKKIPCEGEIPTAVELLEYLGEMYARDTGIFPRKGNIFS